MRKVLFLFGQLNDQDVEWIGGTATTISAPRGTTLIHEGEPLSAVFIVLSGTLAVLPAVLKGRVIAKLGPGEIVGEMSFLDSRPPSATVQAVQDSACLSIPRDLLGQKLQQDPGFAARFYRGLAIILSHRQRAAVLRLGYGDVEGSQPEADPDCLEANVLDNVYLAGARFDRLQRSALR